MGEGGIGGPSGFGISTSYLGRESVDIRVEQGRHIGRPSLLRVRPELDGDTPRVSVGGRVFTSVQGALI